MIRTGKVKILAVQLACVIVASTFWEVYVRSQSDSDRLRNLTGIPTGIAGALLDYASSGIIIADVFYTCGLAIASLVCALLIAGVSALIFSEFPLAGRVASPFLMALNAIPRPAIAPLTVIWFGIDAAPKVFLGASLVYFVALQSSMHELQKESGRLLELLDALAVSRLRRWRFIWLPSILKGFQAAASLCVAYSLIGVVLGELMAASKGLGHRVRTAASVLDMDQSLAVILVIALAGILLSLVSTQILRWVYRRLGSTGSRA